MTQTDRVLDYLTQFGSITALEALRDLGIMHLSSRITELRQRGYPVERDMIEVKNRFGETTRVARYTMEAA
jgi:hypothetical protein